jgi:glycosyltransferase involved in cell wall biosynthesis
LRLIVIGDGEDLPRIQQLTEQYGLFKGTIDFKGAIFDPYVLGEYLLSSDVFVLPGTGGLAINQAIAYGLPVILSSADGTERDIVEDGVNGFYFHASNPWEMADLLERLMICEKLRREMSKESLRISAERSNIDKMVEGFIQAITYLSRGNRVDDHGYHRDYPEGRR